MRESLEVNFLSAAELLEIAAAYFEPQRTGFIAAISSVAGDRGRQSNYIYGAAKAGLSTYLQGLRNRLYHSGVHVLTIKPGFVATRMTFGKVNPNSPIVASPQRVAKDIARAIRRRRNVIYTPLDLVRGSYDSLRDSRSDFQADEDVIARELRLSSDLAIELIMIPPPLAAGELPSRARRGLR